MQTRDIDAIAGPSGTQGPQPRRAALLIDALHQRTSAAESPALDEPDQRRARLLQDFWTMVDA
jgi:hypothetical protein